MKRALSGKFSKKQHYKLPCQDTLKIVLPFAYAFIIAFTGTYLAEAKEFHVNYIKPLYEKQKIIVYPNIPTPKQYGEINTENDVDYGEPEELTIEDRIRKVAKEECFDEVETLVSIAKCESSFNPACGELNNPACINPTNNSFDRGYFQISRKYHPEVSDEDAFNLESATRHAIRIARTSGFSQWACYNKYIR